MMIEDIEYVEEEEKSFEIEGGRWGPSHHMSYYSAIHSPSHSPRRQNANIGRSAIQPILQAFNIQPSTSINIGSIGNNSTVNTAISNNISITPIFIVIGRL